MAFPENRVYSGSSTYANDGTATHTYAADALLYNPKRPCIYLNGKEYILDDERAARIQGYVDDVRGRAIGGHLFVEIKIDLSDYLGQGQGGTADVAIALPEKRLGIIEDLKDGSGEKVWASYLVKPATDTTPEIREPNPQLALYALGMLPSFELFGPVDDVLLVIYQPKLNHIDEFKISREHLLAFGDKAAEAVMVASRAMQVASYSLTNLGYLQPGTKQCRWCRAKTKCPALKTYVEKETSMDFETMEQPAVPMHYLDLAKAYVAVPLVEQWCNDVKAEMQKRVAAGEKILGPDGQPYKFVEGKEGARKWTDMIQAEAALVGQLGPQAYTSPALLTAPAAGKILDKAKSKQLWKDVFEPLISRPRGKPILTFGSDTRPTFSGDAKTDDFEDEISQ
jgi:hypothetical protein